MSRTVTVTTFSEYATEEWPAQEFLRLVQQAVYAIPPEFQGGATASLEGGYEETTKLTISYERPETAEEAAKREADGLRYRLEQEARERATYEALRRKFEPTT